METEHPLMEIKWPEPRKNETLAMRSPLQQYETATVQESVRARKIRCDSSPLPDRCWRPQEPCTHLGHSQKTGQCCPPVDFRQCTRPCHPMPFPAPPHFLHRRRNRLPAESSQAPQPEREDAWVCPQRAHPDAADPSTPALALCEPTARLARSRWPSALRSHCFHRGAEGCRHWFGYHR